MGGRSAELQARQRYIYIRNHLCIFCFCFCHCKMSYSDSVIDPGGMSTFNMLHGFTEALIRGYKSGFLKDADYHHLTQCDSLEVLIAAMRAVLFLH